MIVSYRKNTELELGGDSIEFRETSPLLNKIERGSDHWWKNGIKGCTKWWKSSASRCRSTDVCITSKSALLTLIWSFLIGVMYGLSSNPSRFVLERLRLEIVSVIYILNAICLCFYPLAGFLADNVFGRYKVTIRSLQILLIAPIVTVLPFTSFIVSYIFVRDEGSDELDEYWDNGSLVSIIGMITVSVLFYVVMNVSFVGFNSNVIQFGMEQLHDSPTDHQSLYIYWYVWIHYLVEILILQPWSFLFHNFTAGILLFGILGGGSFTTVAVSLCVAHRIKKFFLINPARSSPYKLVYRVTRFAHYHKVPINRSAFTYYEDKIPAGLDLAKKKYGGPYTTEEVENVKALYGILKILLSLGPFFFLTYASDPAFFWYTRNGLLYKNQTFYNHIFDYNITGSQFAYQYFVDSNILSSLTVVLLIPLYIFIIKPCWRGYRLNMLKRVGSGIVFQMLTLISITILITSVMPGQQHSCIFQNSLKNNNNFSTEVNIKNIQSFIPILPRLLFGIANLLQYTALYEFICAQSPPSMKGLLIGLSFAIKGIFEAVGAAFLIPFSYIPKAFPSCGVWYYITNVLLAIVAFVIFIYVARKYEYRKRDDICDVHRYAEECYFKSLQLNN